MDILIVLAHPDPRSFNSVLADAAAEALRRAGRAAEICDLYADGFDPVLPLEDLRRRASFEARSAGYAEALRAASGLLVIHPDWWGLPPAILKGWVDRVFLPGLAYAYEADGRPGPDTAPLPLLAGRRALVAVTRDGQAVGFSAPFWGRLFDTCGIEPYETLDIGPLRGLGGLEKSKLIEKNAAAMAAWFV